MKILDKQNLVLLKVQELLVWVDKAITVYDTEDSLGLDSLDSIELVMDLEDVFKVEISESELKPSMMIGQLCNLVVDKCEWEVYSEH